MDRRHVRPSLHISNITLQIHECKPYVISTKPTIQIYPTLTNTHDNEGNYQAAIPLERRTWLWAQYLTYIGNMHPKTSIFYIATHSLAPSVVDNLNHTFHLTHLYFFKLLTCPMNFLQYNSTLERDKIFESLGPTITTHWIGQGLAHILYWDLTSSQRS